MRHFVLCFRSLNCKIKQFVWMIIPEAAVTTLPAVAVPLPFTWSLGAALLFSIETPTGVVLIMLFGRCEACVDGAALPPLAFNVFCSFSSRPFLPTTVFWYSGSAVVF